MGRGGLRPDCGGAIQAWPENAGFWGRTFLDLTNDTQNLRNHLRHATAKAHDALDRSMADFDLSDRRSYAGFLTVQLAARAPIHVEYLKNMGVEASMSISIVVRG